MMETIDRDRALGMLRAVVEEKGADHRAVADASAGEANTYYAGDGTTPCCVVGYVFVGLGKTASDLYMTGMRPQTFRSPKAAADFVGANGRGIAYVQVDGVKLTAGARKVLEVAQNLQDKGETWGDALVQAESLAHHLEAAGVL